MSTLSQFFGGGLPETDFVQVALPNTTGILNINNPNNFPFRAKGVKTSTALETVFSLSGSGVFRGCVVHSGGSSSPGMRSILTIDGVSSDVSIAAGAPNTIVSSVGFAGSNGVFPLGAIPFNSSITLQTSRTSASNTLSWAIDYVLNK